MLEQPARSEALKLRYMTSRSDVVKAVVAQCAFGLKDLENGRPYLKLTSLDVNCSVMAAQLLCGAYCTHGPGEHQQIEGSCKVGGRTLRRSETAAAWPEKLCDRILEAAGRIITEPDGATTLFLVVSGG